MIVNFSIQNFGSIKDKQTLSFEADKSTHLEDTYIINAAGLRLLKLALIYGANASGKTTVLKALGFLRELVLNPENKKTEELKFEPFLFDPYTPTQNTILSIEFIQNGIRYYYEVEFFKKAIVKEELYSHEPNKANIYKRQTDLSNQFTKITFGSKIKKDKIFENNLEVNTLWNNTVLGGYLKTNIDFKELREVIEWFESYLTLLIYPETFLSNTIASQIQDGMISKSDMVNILKKADFNISDIVLREERNNRYDNYLESLKERGNAQSDKIKEVEEIAAKNPIVKIELEHTVNDVKYTLPLALESEGTKRYYGLAGLLVFLIETSTAFSIDELEASLHPDLYLHFLLSFLLNSKKSQLIATTHNREIFNNKDIFRNDAIWFTNKKENCSTELYSLADFDSSVVRNTTNVLNAYKSGKLEGIPNLGDNFIDLGQ